ncbi:MAG: tRNA lysidine(34) synthetase TilS [candidate division KSB1 bacterium]|nr:tRNA lysidine(34) synthetase TilS [candidate division KSB1 bacterium]
MPELLEAFRKKVMETSLIRRGEHVLVAVSGGLDSVTLLHLLVSVKDAYGLQVSAAHLNHSLRGEEADEDERFVAALCEELAVPCVRERRDVRRYAQVHRLSEETAARVVRYDFLRRVKQQLKATAIATAHHADDQVETVIDHFLRGAGLSGLAGMAPRRGDVVRPLLWATRAEIERYARACNLRYRIDRSNFNLEFRRNRIRLELLPYLRRYFNPGVREAVLRSAQIVAEAEAFIEEQAHALLQVVQLPSRRDEVLLDALRLAEQPPLLQKYAVLTAFERLGGSRWLLDYDRLERVVQLIREGSSGARLNLGAGIEMVKSQSRLALQKARQVEFCYPLPIGATVEVPEVDMVISAEVVDRATYVRDVGLDARVEFVDLDALRGPLEVRNARPGDRFRPLGSSGSKKLSDLFTDAKVPAYERWRTPVVTDGANIVWVCGLRLDDRYKVTDKTQRILKLAMGERISGEE